MEECNHEQKKEKSTIKKSDVKSATKEISFSDDDLATQRERSSCSRDGKTENSVEVTAGKNREVPIKSELKGTDKAKPGTDEIHDKEYYKENEHLQKFILNGFIPWTREDIQTLIKNIILELPQSKKGSVNQLEKLNWAKICFDVYSEEDCKNKIYHLISNIRIVKTLEEIVKEVKSKIKKNEIVDGLFLEPTQLYAVDFISRNKGIIQPCKMFEACAKSWIELTDDLKFRYIEKHFRQKRDPHIKYDKRLYYLKHPFELFYEEQCNEIGRRNYQFKREMMEKYKTISVEEKCRFIYNSFKCIYYYMVESSKHLCSMGSSHWKENLRGIPSNAEVTLLLKYLGVPKSPPVSAPFLFREENKYFEFQLKDIHEAFQKLSSSEKKYYKDKRAKMVAKYVKEYSSWLSKQDEVIQMLVKEFYPVNKLKREASPAKWVPPEAAKDKSVPVEEESCSRKGRDIKGKSFDSKKKFEPPKEAVFEDGSVPLEKESYSRKDRNEKIKYANLEDEFEFVKEKKKSGDSDKKNMPLKKEVYTYIHTYSDNENMLSKEEVTTGQSVHIRDEVSPHKYEPIKYPDAKAAFAELSSINPELSVKAKVKRLRKWREWYDELALIEKERYKSEFEKLRIDILHMIIVDIQNLKRKKRKAFLLENGNFLNAILRTNCFEDDITY